MTSGTRSTAQNPSHLPVLWTQVLDGLRVLRDGRYLDGTFGRGGHARGVLERLGPAGRLLVMDKDPVAMASAAELISQDARVGAFQGSFAELGRLLRPQQFATLPPDFRELSPSYRVANPAGVERWLAIEKAAHQAIRAPAQKPRNAVTFASRKHPRTYAAHNGRVRFLHAASGAADVQGSHARGGYAHTARRGPFGVLGAAGVVQPRRAGVHWQALPPALALP